MTARRFGNKISSYITNKSYYYVYNSSMLCTAEFSLQGATLQHFFFILSTLITFYDFNFHVL